MRKICIFSFLLLLLVSLVCFDSLFGILPKKSEEIVFPDIVGKSFLLLEEDLASLPVTLETEMRYDEFVPEGIILSQSPSAKSVQKLSSRRECVFHLVISLGKKTVTVPDVVGLDARTAGSVLREAGLTVETQSVPGGKVGAVLSSSPAEGSEVSSGSRVLLTVGEGNVAKSVSVPSLVGMSRGNAVFEIFLRGLTLGDVTEEESDLPAGIVLRQTPEKGTLCRPGTQISLTVSKNSNDKR